MSVKRLHHCLSFGFAMALEQESVLQLINTVHSGVNNAMLRELMEGRSQTIITFKIPVQRCTGKVSKVPHRKSP